MKTKVFYSDVCPTCGKSAHSPFRSHDDKSGKIVSGCVDEFHTGHLVSPSSSASWHARQEAKKIRASMKAGRLGGVTKRKENPRVAKIAIGAIPKRGPKTILWFDGKHFRSKGVKRRFFSTPQLARSTAMVLLQDFPILRSYRVGVYRV